MASTIGRAGKQVFSQLESGQGGIKDRNRSEIALSINNNNNHGNSTTTLFASSLPPPSKQTNSSSLFTENPVKTSVEDMELEETLAQCKLLEAEKVLSPSSNNTTLSPLRQQQRDDREVQEEERTGGEVIIGLDKIGKLPSSSSDKPSFIAPYPYSNQTSSTHMNSASFLSSNFSVKKFIDESIAVSGMNGSKKIADLEKQELLAALEVLKMQNQMLSNRIEKTQQESRMQLEYERQQRLLAVSSLEKENQVLLEKLLQAKEEAEHKLEKEKEMFSLTLQQMTDEKSLLTNKLQILQQQSEEVVSSLIKERQMMENAITQLESDREAMKSKVLEIEAMNDKSLLQNDLENLQLRLQSLEDQKGKLELQLASNEKDMLAQSEAFQEKLRLEQVRLQEIESRQTEAGNRLTKASADLQAAEKELKMAQASSRSHSLRATPRSGSASALITSAPSPQFPAPASLPAPIPTHAPVPVPVSGLTSAIAPSPRTIEATVKANSTPTASEKKSVARQDAKKKAQALQDKLRARKQERISNSVNKMRANFEQEKLQKSQQSSQNSSAHDLLPESHPANSAAQSSAAKKGISARQSLYDMLAPTQTIPSTQEGYEINTNFPLRISMVGSTKGEGGINSQLVPPLVKDKSVSASHKTFMDIDSSDEEDEGGKEQRKKSQDTQDKSPSTKQATSSSAITNANNTATTTATVVGGLASGDNAGDASGELPSAHAAASRGDLNTLRELITNDPTLLESLDVSNRLVIFYAAVHGHVNIIIYLLQLYTSVNIHHVFSYDIFGDSVINAAVCGNSSVCLELLLSKMDKVYSNAEEKLSIVNHRNSYGMTPAHMVSELSCLELIYKFGADMSIVDAQHRTPLFVFCLLNNEKCVNFLLSSYDCLDYLYKADYRGDTPLHAAACNGSVECLLALLQQGVDPRIVNAQNLRAVDLAIRNKQHKCREILAEYLLHYCTNSDFDSVLFLDVIEGHRYIAQNIHNLPKESPTSLLETVSPLPKLLNKNHMYPSLFTLRDAKTMRLERYGKWIAYYDPYTDRGLWYDSENHTGQWEIPQEVQQQWQEQATSSIKQNPTNDEEERENKLDKVLQSKLSMRLKRRGDWIEYATSGNTPIFYNEKDGSFTWTDPFQSNETSHKDNQTKSYNPIESSFDEPTDDPSFSPSTAPWQPYIDEASGSVYWYNTMTTASQWENPYEDFGETPEEVYTRALVNSKESNNNLISAEEDAHEAHLIENLHDLGV